SSRCRCGGLGQRRRCGACLASTWFKPGRRKDRPGPGAGVKRGAPPFAEPKATAPLGERRSGGGDQEPVAGVSVAAGAAFGARGLRAALGAAAAFFGRPGPAFLAVLFTALLVALLAALLALALAFLAAAASL